MSFFSHPAKRRSDGRDFRPTSWLPTSRCGSVARRREGGTVRGTSHDGISQAARRSLASVPRCPHFVRRGLTPRWSQRRLPLEFMGGFSYKTIIELAEPLARRRGSALDRYGSFGTSKTITARCISRLRSLRFPNTNFHSVSPVLPTSRLKH